MTRRAGSDYVIGYGGTAEVPTLDIISTERNVVGNLVGTYNELAELMALAARGSVMLHTTKYPLDAVNDAMDDLEQGRERDVGATIVDALAARALITGKTTTRKRSTRRARISMRTALQR